MFFIHQNVYFTKKFDPGFAAWFPHVSKVGMLVPLAQVREPFSAIRWVMERSEKPLAELLGLKPVNLRRVRDLLDAGLELLGVSKRLRLIAQHLMAYFIFKKRFPNRCSWKWANLVLNKKIKII